MVKKIALEEHFSGPGFDRLLAADHGRMSAAKIATACSAASPISARQRLATMDQAGIARAVLAIAGPGVQVERDTATAIRNARARQRFSRQRDPEAARPLFRLRASADAGRQGRRRRTRTLRHASSKFCGAMINGHTNGQYLDHPSLRSVLGARGGAGRADLSASDRSGRAAPVLDGYNGLRRATWEWGFETGSHALRLVFGGVFDRFPTRQARPRPSRRDAAVPALALRQPRRSSTA